MTEHEYELEQDIMAEQEYMAAMREKRVIDALNYDPTSVIERLTESLSTHIADAEGDLFRHVFDRDHEAIVEAIGDWWGWECENEYWDTY